MTNLALGSHFIGVIMSEMVFCRGCGKEIHKSALSCPHCGARQRSSSAKSKVVAGVLALLLGGLGIHRFYLGQWWGLLYLAFCWTFVPLVIAFIEAIIFFLSSDEAWEAKYG
jgi:TM2 domain-containing membrane protein YozV